MYLVINLLMAVLLVLSSQNVRAEGTTGKDEIGESELCRLCKLQLPDMKSRISDHKKARLFPHLKEIESNQGGADATSDK